MQTLLLRTFYNGNHTRGIGRRSSWKTVDSLTVGGSRDFFRFPALTGSPFRSGANVFYRSAAGEIFYTYSGYARAGDIPYLAPYHYLDHTPKGPNERMIVDWVRHHDSYEAKSAGSHSHSEPVLPSFGGPPP